MNFGERLQAISEGGEESDVRDSREASTQEVLDNFIQPTQVQTEETSTTSTQEVLDNFIQPTQLEETSTTSTQEVLDNIIQPTQGQETTSVPINVTNSEDTGSSRPQTPSSISEIERKTATEFAAIETGTKVRLAELRNRYPQLATYGPLVQRIERKTSSDSAGAAASSAAGITPLLRKLQIDDNEISDSELSVDVRTKTDDRRKWKPLDDEEDEVPLTSMLKRMGVEETSEEEKPDNVSRKLSFSTQDGDPDEGASVAETQGNQTLEEEEEKQSQASSLDLLRGRSIEVTRLTKEDLANIRKRSEESNKRKAKAIQERKSLEKQAPPVETTENTLPLPSQTTENTLPLPSDTAENTLPLPSQSSSIGDGNSQTQDIPLQRVEAVGNADNAPEGNAPEDFNQPDFNQPDDNQPDENQPDENQQQEEEYQEEEYQGDEIGAAGGGGDDGSSGSDGSNGSDESNDSGDDGSGPIDNNSFDDDAPPGENIQIANNEPPVGAFEGYSRIYTQNVNLRVIGLINAIRREIDPLCGEGNSLDMFIELQDRCLKLLNQPRNPEFNRENISTVCRSSVAASIPPLQQTLASLTAKIAEFQKQTNAAIELANAKTPTLDPCEAEKDCLSKRLAELETILKDKMNEFTTSIVNSFKFLPVGTPIDNSLTSKCTLPADEQVNQNIFLRHYWDVFRVDPSREYFDLLTGFTELHKGDPSLRIILDENSPLLDATRQQEDIVVRMRNKLNMTIYDWIALAAYRKDTILAEQNEIMVELEGIIEGLDFVAPDDIKLIWTEVVHEITLPRLSRYVIGGGIEDVMVRVYFNRKADDDVNERIENHIKDYVVVIDENESYVDYVYLLGNIGVSLPEQSTPENIDSYVKARLKEYYQEERTRKIQGYLLKKNTRNLFRMILQQELIEMEKFRLKYVHMHELSDDTVLEVARMIDAFRQADLAADNITILYRVNNALDKYVKANNIKTKPGRDEVYNKVMLRLLYERESRIFFEDDDVIGPSYSQFFQKVGKVDVQILGELVEWEHREDHMVEEGPLYSAYIKVFQFLVDTNPPGKLMNDSYEQGFILLYYFWFALSQKNNFDLLRVIFESPKVKEKELLCSILASIDVDGIVENVIEKAPVGSLAYRMVSIRKFAEIQQRIPNWGTLYKGNELVSSYKNKSPFIECYHYQYNLMDIIDDATDFYTNGICVHVCPYHEIEVLSSIHRFKIPCEIVSLTRKGYTSKVYKLIKNKN